MVLLGGHYSGAGLWSCNGVIVGPCTARGRGGISTTCVLCACGTFFEFCLFFAFEPLNKMVKSTDILRWKMDIIHWQGPDPAKGDDGPVQGTRVGGPVRCVCMQDGVVFRISFLFFAFEAVEMVEK